MQGLANKWKAMLQSQSTQELKFSRMTAPRNEDQKNRNKQFIGLYSEQASKLNKDREGKSKQKQKKSRTKSNEQRKASASKYLEGSGFQPETPVKLSNKNSEKMVERYTTSIVQLLQEGQSSKIRPKIKAILEDLLVNLAAENNMSSSLRVSVGDRAYQDLEQRYLQSEKERQYLKGKMQMFMKRYEGLERQLERYSKVEKLIDSSINRQNELRQEINRVKAEKTLLEAQMQQQNQTFSREVQSIKALIETLKGHLPIN